MNIIKDYLQNPVTLAGIAFMLAAVFWFFLSRRRKRGPAATGHLDAVQVIYLLSLLAMLVLAVLMWNDRAISMPLLRSADKEKAELRTVGDQSPSIRSGGPVSGGQKAGAGRAKPGG
ncbi:MAG: hypothetical protein ACTFAL_10240 [Candidatus Electronema sp. V4]|uniref:hypothetical protein n=1 Tax=Candidatus Electronema sp. V4 TaxID=3454756 RepID=UPI0040558B07